MSRWIATKPAVVIVSISPPRNGAKDTIIMIIVESILFIAAYLNAGFIGSGSCPEFTSASNAGEGVQEPLKPTSPNFGASPVFWLAMFLIRRLISVNCRTMMPRPLNKNMVMQTIPCPIISFKKNVAARSAVKRKTRVRKVFFLINPIILGLVDESWEARSSLVQSASSEEED